MMALVTGSATRAGEDAGNDLAEALAPAALALARRFAGGATLWCVAPEWPGHARHVAVEFVHPVIVGTRALPAVSVEATDAVATLRLLARPGDVLMTVATAGEPVTSDLLARADAWGLTTVCIGCGPRPSPGTVLGPADHVVWLADADPAVVARSGDLVLLYHLLWELTHVVFEHPGLLAPEPAPCTDEVCVTCSDEGRVAEVHAVLPDGHVEVLAGGRTERVDARLLGDVVPGDLLLVHAGVAVTSLPAPARKTVP